MYLKMHPTNGASNTCQDCCQDLAHHALATKFSQLPAELRLRIWTCAAESRVIIIDDLVHVPRAYPLPPVAQLNFEARHECRDGYEQVGLGSHVNFSKDIIVCGPSVTDEFSNRTLEGIAPRIKRLAFWDCFPDDIQIARPYGYASYLARSYHQERLGKIQFDKFWFPNLKDVWIIKIGEIHGSWLVKREKNYELRLRQTARQFRYWINEDIVEIAPLDLDEPENRAVLQEGRCSRNDCQRLNEGRPRMVSKVTFMDTPYQTTDNVGAWKQILPLSTRGRKTTEENMQENEMRLRWCLVERALTFSLRWDAADDTEGERRGMGRRMECPPCLDAS